MPSRKSLILLVSAVLAAALAASAWFVATHREEILTDGSGIEILSSDAKPRDIVWQPPEAVGAEEIPAAAVAGSASADGDRFVFAAPGPNGDLDLFESRRTSGGLWESRRLDTASSHDQDTTPCYSPDGRWIWFASDRPGGQGGYDLWRAPASPDGWGTPEYVRSDAVQTKGDELSPSLSSGGDLLVFARRRSSAEPADLVLVSLGDGTPEREITHELNTLADERSPAFSPAGDFVYFASDRPGGAGGSDLYRARFTGTIFDQPSWLGEEVNTTADETSPTIDTAGFRMRFRATADGSGGYQQTTAREMFRSVRSSWPDLGLGAKLLGLLPWILAALALVLLFAALKQLASRERWQRRWGTLGLMARCVLASLAIHAALAFLLSLWQVGTGLPTEDGTSGTQVALTTRSSINDIAAQLNAPALSSRQAPQDNARPQPAPAAEAGEVQMEPTKTAVAATPATLSEVPAPSETHAAHTPSMSESVVRPQRSMPSASRSQADEPTSQLQPAATASGQVQPSSATPRTARLSPAETANPNPVLGSVREADTSRDLTPTIESALPALSHQTELPNMPSQDRAAVQESSSQQTAANTESGDTVSTAPVQPNTVVLPTHSARAPPTATHISDASADADPSLDEAPQIQPLLDLGFESADLPTTGLAQEKPETPNEATLAAETTSQAVAPAASRALLVEPQAAALPAIPDELGEASAALPDADSPPLPVLTALAPGLLPEARADAESEHVPQSKHGAVELDPLPATVPDASSIRANAADAEAPALIETLADAAAPAEQARPQLPLLASDAIPRTLPAAPPAPLISGIVLDATTGDPIEGSLARLDGEADTIRTALTGPGGRFALSPPQLPDFAVLTVSADGYASMATNVSRADVADGIWLEFRLLPTSEFDIALDADPRVHHLGNDEFTGAINSQFQVRSQGIRYTRTFALDRSQLVSPTAGAELTMLVRGAQNRNPITVNGRRLQTAVTDSPSDGSFGTFTARIPLSVLRVGENVIEIRATAREGTDIDDFEFVNPRIILLREQRRNPNSF